jgi:hypothetical protein
MGSLIAKIFVLLAFLGMWSSLLFSWWFWFDSSFEMATWRKRLLLSALVGASFDMGLRFLGHYWLIFFLKFSHTVSISVLPFLLWAFLAAAFFGKGRVRVLLVVYCVLSILFRLPSLILA